MNKTKLLVLMRLESFLIIKHTYLHRDLSPHTLQITRSNLSESLGRDQRPRVPWGCRECWNWRGAESPLARGKWDVFAAIGGPQIFELDRSAPEHGLTHGAYSFWLDAIAAGKLFRNIVLYWYCWECEIPLFSVLALWGNKNWPPSIKMKQIENSQNKMGLKP